MQPSERRADEAEPELVLGIDAGTGSLRAALFDLSGRPHSFYDVAYATGTRYPRPGWAEQQPQDWWEALVAAVRGCLSRADITSRRVVGLAIDAPCDLVLLDASGAPLTDGIMWMDLRASEQARRLTLTHDPVLRYCGGDVPAEWPLPKALWLKEQLPALWDQAAYVVEQLSWLTWRLTGAWALSLNSAAAKWHYRAAGDQDQDQDAPMGWPTSLLHTIGLDDLREKIPGFVAPMGSQVGELSREAAAALGLPAGIAVAMGGIDAYAGMLGIGALVPGEVALVTGTSTCQLVQSATPLFHPGLWGPFMGAVTPGEWTLEAGQASTGGTVRWLLEMLGGELPPGAERYAAADAAAAATPSGADGLTVLDFWQGSRTPIKDPHARGAIIGLTPAHGVGHLLRAVYEGTAYGNRHILETFRSLGAPIERIIACGGGTRSALWLQILADVAGVPLYLTAVDDAVALGSAICAAVGANRYPDLKTAAGAMVQPLSVIQPDPTTRDVYDRGYERYRALQRALAPERL